MSHSQMVRVRTEDFAVTMRASAWQACDTLDAVDGTIEMEAHPLRQPERTVAGLIQGRLSRGSPGGPFTVSFSENQVCELIEEILELWADEEPGYSEDAFRPEYFRVDDARWRITDCPVPHTDAPRYAGGAYRTFESELGLIWEDWMQDWPLLVSDPSRLDEFCAFYERNTDRIIRFDTMQLALYSYDECRELDAIHTDWFDRMLRRDFALHGYSIAYWAALERPSDDPEFQRPDPEFVFTISGLLRRIWDESLIPIELDWRLT